MELVKKEDHMAEQPNEYTKDFIDEDEIAGMGAGVPDPEEVKE